MPSARATAPPRGGARGAACRGSVSAVPCRVLNMFISPEDALEVARQLSERIRAADEHARALRDMRATWLFALDGQEGITRNLMAEACGVNRFRIFGILAPDSPERERTAEGVLVPLDLIDQLRELDAGVWVDVHA